MGAASVTTASVPRNWGGQQLLDDVLMVTETELHPNVAKVRHTSQCLASTTCVEIRQTMSISQQAWMQSHHKACQATTSVMAFFGCVQLAKSLSMPCI
jgi:hypothetical protein